MHLEICGWSVMYIHIYRSSVIIAVEVETYHTEKLNV